MDLIKVSFFDWQYRTYKWQARFETPFKEEIFWEFDITRLIENSDLKMLDKKNVRINCGIMFIKMYWIFICQSPNAKYEA